ncbi:hypothetical protein EDB80DRAFT_277233 [Ilyonectria destructans]|nr:hypothetical protein EDB80DRAFT_277233 [Ilyonectria destructans]
MFSHGSMGAWNAFAFAFACAGRGLFCSCDLCRGGASLGFVPSVAQLVWLFGRLVRVRVAVPTADRARNVVGQSTTTENHYRRLHGTPSSDHQPARIHQWSIRMGSAAPFLWPRFFLYSSPLIREERTHSPPVSDVPSTRQPSLFVC